MRERSKEELDLGVKTLVKAFAACLKEAGFSRRSRRWWRNQRDSMAEIDLQRSQWSCYFYVNCTVSLKAVDDPSKPLLPECRIDSRLDRLVPDQLALRVASDFSDLHNSIDEKIEVLVASLKNHGLPWLDGFRDLNDVVEKYQKQDLIGSVNTKAKALLDRRVELIQIQT